MRVLITGSSGLIGGILWPHLATEHQVSGIDIKRSRGTATRVADMTKPKSIQPAFRGQDVVIDLAGAASPTSSWDQVAENNIRATANAFEASRQSGVRRIIYASSNHVTGMYEREQPYAAIVAGDYNGLDPAAVRPLTTDLPVRPDGPYGIGKAFGEAAARYYSDEHGLSVICLRIGTVNRDDRPRNSRHFATLLSHRDLAHLVRCCIGAPEALRFAVFYGVSNNRWRFWNIADSADAVDYRPLDDAETWR